jgi:cytochrome P450
MFRLSLDVVMDVLFGHRLGDDAPAVVDATLGVLDHLIVRSRTIPGIPSWCSPAAHLRFRRALNALDDVITEVLETRRTIRAQPAYQSRDLLDLLLDAEGSKRITAQGVRDEMLTMIIAGHETVASALTWTWHLVSEAPDVEAALIDEACGVSNLTDARAALDSLPGTGRAFAEGLRLYPPAWIVTRKAKPTTTSPEWLPRNTLVMLSPYVTHRHADVWKDAGRFDPSRFLSPPMDGTYFPFGAGPRLCIGRDFALVEAVVVMWGVSRRCRLRTVSTEVGEYAGVTLQPEGGLRAAVLPHT